jgi:integrase/recombinase XerD
MLTIRIKNIDFENDIISIKNYEDFTTKNYSDREIPMFSDLKPILISIIQRSKSGLLFKDRSQSRFCGSYISHKFKKLLRQCKISEDLHFHNLRHTFATNCISQGMPLPMVQKIMGHRDIQTTMIYRHFSTKSIINQMTGKSLYSFD